MHYKLNPQFQQCIKVIRGLELTGIPLNIRQRRWQI